MTHDEFMAIMTKQMYVWRLAKNNTRPGSSRTQANAEFAINEAVKLRAASLADAA